MIEQDPRTFKFSVVPDTGPEVRPRPVRWTPSFDKALAVWQERTSPEKPLVIINGDFVCVYPYED